MAVWPLGLADRPVDQLGFFPQPSLQQAALPSLQLLQRGWPTRDSQLPLQPVGT